MLFLNFVKPSTFNFFVFLQQKSYDSPPAEFQPFCGPPRGPLRKFLLLCLGPTFDFQKKLNFSFPKSWISALFVDPSWTPPEMSPVAHRPNFSFFWRAEFQLFIKLNFSFSKRKISKRKCPQIPLRGSAERFPKLKILWNPLKSPENPQKSLKIPKSP